MQKKIIIVLKNLKKRKENKKCSPELQKPNIETEVYNNNKKYNKNKVQQIDPANKGNQKLHLPVKSKTN